MKKIGFLVLMFALTVLLQTCKQNEYKYQYVNLGEFFPYLTKVFEENTFKFVRKDIKRLRYVLNGFKTYGNRLPRTWAVEKESSIIAYFSELEDKTVVLRCYPFNLPGQPHQVGEIYINGNHLKTIEFREKGQYHFDIPANLLNYGSNHITFKWKYLRSPKDFGMDNDRRKYAAGFSYLKFQSKSKKNKKRKMFSKIHLNLKDKIPGIHLPHGGIIEYFVDLPGESHLRFRLSCKPGYLKDSILHLAVYNESGKKITRDFKSHQFYPGKEHRINLNKFAKKTVKIVFANSIRNHPNFTVSLINPAIYSSSEPGSPAFLKVDRGGAGKKKIGKPQQRNINTKMKPNVFIYLIDTLRADHLSCYGYYRETTPYIDQFSKAAILFKNCFATASWTKPTVGSVLTGLYPNRHRGEDDKDKLSSEVQTISEVLKSWGYTTIYITPNVNAAREVNFDQGIDIYKFSTGGKHVESFYHSSEYLNSEFFRIIENNPHLMNKPLFAYLHTVDPHDPYTPKEPFLKFKKFDKERENLELSDNIRLKKKAKGLSQEDIDYIKSLYDCEILHNDYYFGKFIEFLKEKDLFENSIIVLVADHGEQFDEHGALFHSQSIYNEETHVPLIIKFPYGEYSSIRTDGIVSQVDIFPTILDYLGIEISADVDGVSIFNILNNEHFKRSVFIKEKLNRGYDKSNIVGFINTYSKKKHVITYRNELFINASNVELYDLEKDFAEKTDKFEKENIFWVKSIKFLADYFLEKMKSSRFKKEKKLDLKKLDPEKVKQLRALGYLN